MSAVPTDANTATAPARRPDPIVNPITFAEIGDALGAGIRDFQAAPLYGLFFGVFFALGGILVLASATWLDMAWLPYPLAGGFAILGPFIAVGLYEVSRRREQGAPMSWGLVLGVMFNARKSDLGFMAFVTLFIFVIWLYQVRLLLALFLGFQSFATLNEFLTVLVTTPEGLMFLAAGNVVGAILALFVYTITVVSFPLLLDRDVDFVTAMITSVKAVTTSPVTMLGWGVAVTLLLIVASLPAFLGLVVILPVLGHATWHLYRKIVAFPPEDG